MEAVRSSNHASGIPDDRLDEPIAPADGYPQTMSSRVCFVTVVESGLLEPMAVRMVESLRRFGGRLSDAPVLAVKPRFGPPLARSTHRRFDELGVRFIGMRSHPQFAWFHYLNKPLAMLAAEQRSDADILAWVDADVLVREEPSAFLLPADVAFTAGPTDYGVVGTTGPHDIHDPYWRAICDALGMELEELPWLTTYVGQEKIRFYLNAGIFAYRRRTGLAEHWLRTCLRALEARVGFAESGETRLEQVSLGLTVLQQSLPWRPLRHSHNLALASYLDDEYDDGLVADARLLHYHDSLEPHQWQKFLRRADVAWPELAEWLRPQGPISNPAPRHWQLAGEIVRMARGFPRRIYRARMIDPVAVRP